ncbi:unnamed protein product, partial [Adineta steineri]
LYYLGRLFYSWVRRLRSKKSVDSHAKVFKIIPVSKEKEKKWYEFEGASTYKYSQAEVRALKSDSAKKNVSQDLRVVVNKTENDTDKDDSDNTVTGLKQAYDELNQLKKDIKFLVVASTPQSTTTDNDSTTTETMLPVTNRVSSAGH